MPEAFGGLFWMLLSVAVDLSIRGTMLKMWLKLSDRQAEWQWVLSVGALSQVPILVEEAVRLGLLSQMGANAPSSLSLAVVFGPVGEWFSPVFNPFVYWQFYILSVAVQDARPLGLGSRAFIALAVSVTALLNALAVLVST